VNKSTYQTFKQLFSLPTLHTKKKGKTESEEDGPKLSRNSYFSLCLSLFSILLCMLLSKGFQVVTKKDDIRHSTV